MDTGQRLFSDQEMAFVVEQGQVGELEVRCKHSSRRFKLEQNVAWKMPASWQGCRLYTFGEVGSIFKLYQYKYASRQAVSVAAFGEAQTYDMDATVERMKHRHINDIQLM